MIIGETISHYRVVELLGAGGMGEVFKAEDTKLKRPVALKFLPLGLTQDRDAKQRLLHEAQAASTLDHPNICTIYEIEETPEGRLFVAMAYYEGRTLRDRLVGEPLTVHEALTIVTHVARGVAAAHDAGIVHRDIKPANIMLTTRGEVKLLDFGVAKLAGQTVLTRTGTTLGTVAYMAPEQVTGGVADERSDVWAVGVVLYEMLARTLPFRGEHELALLQAIANESPVPLKSIRSDVPAALEAVVAKALQKDPARRYASARELVADLEALRTPTGERAGEPAPAMVPRRPFAGRVAIASAAAAVLAIVAVGGWYVLRERNARWAAAQIAEAGRLLEAGEDARAWRILRQAEPYIQGRAELTLARDALLLPVTIHTDPSGADVYAKPYADVDGQWELLGRSPLSLKGPNGLFRWRVTRSGFTSFEGSAGMGMGEISIALTPEGSVPEGMVAIPEGAVQVGPGESVRLPAFFIDRFEVTNREFKRFVDEGGYRKAEYWTEPFIKDGRALSFDEAMSEFRDATGRPGPSTWELGLHPEGQDDYPVHGVSWYEAVAYARFAGRQLPTVHHWRHASGSAGYFSNVLEFSNFSGKGPARVGTYQGIGPYGTFDMAGNAKEWCWNEERAQRYILGGAWYEPNYQFSSLDARSPFERVAGNGFRTMRVADPSALPAVATAPVTELARDYDSEKPVPAEIYRTYERMFAYDRIPLDSSIESTDDSSPFWRRERVTYAAAYGGERIVAYLFLPKDTPPPYQTVIYFPHSGGLALRSFEQGEMSYLGFVVKSRRALLFPMYKGTYERRLTTPISEVGPNARRDLAIQMIKDLRRSIDYVETRADLDADRLAYFGVSLGARLASIALAVEPRFKAAIIWSGGFSLAARPAEVDEINFAPHVRTPILMANGRDDFTFPVETSQKPMLRLLGTPEADKRYISYPGGHNFPFARIVKDSLDWLDKYLGTPR
jgi:dienelactone hydrolase